MASNYKIEDESWFLWSQKYKGRVWIGKKAIKPTNVKSKLTNRKSMQWSWLHSHANLRGFQSP